MRATTVFRMRHGEYIGFVDSDDYLNVTMYQKLYDRAVKRIRTLWFAAITA